MTLVSPADGMRSRWRDRRPFGNAPTAERRPPARLVPPQTLASERAGPEAGAPSAGPWGALLALALLLAGCRTPSLVDDFDGPGWSVRQGQAVWTAAVGEAGVAGELLVACGPSGACLVQFSKPPLSLVTARARAETWSVDMPQARRRFDGHGRAPTAFVWFALAEVLAGDSPSAGWQFERPAPDAFRLSNTRTGEALSGFFTP